MAFKKMLLFEELYFYFEGFDFALDLYCFGFIKV